LPLGTVTTQSPSPVVVVTVVPLLELDEAELLVETPADRVLTDGPPVEELLTPSGPAVTELDTAPVFFASSEWTTVQGLPFGPVETVVLPETPFGPAVTVLV